MRDIKLNKLSERDREQCTQELVDTYILYFPMDESRITEYRLLSFCEVLIKLNNGRVVIFDQMTNGCILVKRSSEDVTDEVIKRYFKIRLKSIMKLKYVTQQELSEMTGISRYLISNYINGKTSPSFLNIDKIARALECSVDDFRYY